MFSYILVVVAMATGQAPQVSFQDFRSLEACKAAQRFVLENEPRGTNQSPYVVVNAACVLSRAN